MLAGRRSRSSFPAQKNGREPRDLSIQSLFCFMIAIEGPAIAMLSPGSNEIGINLEVGPVSL